MANPKGTPIWFEYNTTDKAAAKAFYSALTGWQIAPSPMDEHGSYLIANAADKLGVAGIMSPPQGASRFPGWAIYFASPDVDADAAKVTSLGGKIHVGPQDIPGVGRFAVASDPQGVVFFLMKGASPEDSQAFRQGRGASNSGHAVWIELATPDPDKAFAFYGDLFGWTKEGAMPMGAMGEYAFIGTPNAVACTSGQKMSAGAVMSSTRTGAPARWNWYVYVPDLDAAVAAAKAKGGKLLKGPDPIPGGDFSANVADPDGQHIGIVGARKSQTR